MLVAFELPGVKSLIPLVCCCITIALGGSGAAYALSVEQLKPLAEDDFDAKVQVINQLAADGSEAAQQILAAVQSDTLYARADETLLIQEGDRYRNPLDGGVVAANADDLSQITLGNVLRTRAANALAGMQLRASDPAVRSRAISALMAQPDPNLRESVETARRQETDPRLKARLDQLWALTALHAPDPQSRAQAARLIGQRGDLQLRSLLQPLANPDPSGNAPDAEKDSTVRAAAQEALRKLDFEQFKVDFAGTTFAGLSLGSVLLLAALGLAITYGLIGVINMAHGEFLLIGAYTTYVVQNAFRTYWPGAFDLYPLLAAPAAFILTAIVGLILERTLIRWLYGRPLETLLATFGVSLMMMQGARAIFGAQNVQVENPSWMRGGWAMLPNLILPFNRIVILGFAFAVVGITWLILNRTRLGLYIRAVTQNRRMAACSGIVTWKVDAYAFAFGAGVAGLGGCALSQIGNVGPDLGQTYIIDSFMAVVLGGVGQLSGTIFGSMGLGLINKTLEPFCGAVLAKICVLIFIILFIQKRPQGLFALKGRSVEA
ncbi:MAG: urea ABC transporter permease subunit UrtB [Verrucomicrobia bacterium]|nr:urea ABC transporter permease subunit UrtB [Verrucomicrobiota bacterium]